MILSKFTTTALAALMAVGVALPTMSTSADARHRHGRGLAIGAGVVLGAAALAAASRSSYAGEGRSYCSRLAYRCDRGSRRACWRYDDECR